MKKVLFQFFVFATAFFSCWLLLSKIDFVKHMHVEKIGNVNEKRIGDLIIDNIKRTNKEITTDSVVQVLEEMKNKICRNNNIDSSEIKIHLLDDNVINAFTLPDKHMILYTGLIEHCDSASELAGIMAHEIGHMQHGHVMKKLIKELGIAVVVSVGGGNSEILRNIVQTLSSRAFDRKQEREADAAAVGYLNNARIDPKGLANFLLRMEDEKKGMPKQLEWISTHPDSKARADEIMGLRNRLENYMPVISDKQWKLLKKI
jgi:predicted Zn-dependent protease